MKKFDVFGIASEGEERLLGLQNNHCYNRQGWYLELPQYRDGLIRHLDRLFQE